MNTHEKPKRLDLPEESISERIPQAIDPTHPLHNTFWHMVACGGVFLSEEDFAELLDAFQEEKREIAESNRAKRVPRGPFDDDLG